MNQDCTTFESAQHFITLFKHIKLTYKLINISTDKMKEKNYFYKN